VKKIGGRWGQNFLGSKRKGKGSASEIMGRKGGSLELCNMKRNGAKKGGGKTLTMGKGGRVRKIRSL